MFARFFKPEEFRCPCCGEVKIDPLLVSMLDAAREMAGVPFIITSGYRCERHNREVGGKPDSAHLKGLAADIATSSAEERYKIFEALIRVGFRRLGIGKDFVHADIDPRKPQGLLWLYD